MKKLLLFCAIIVSLSACKKDCNEVCFNGGTCKDDKCFCPPGYYGTNCESVYGGGGGGGTQSGRVTFWYNSYGSNATVYIGGQSGQVTQYYSSYDPSCGSGGCANFTLTPGSYNYTASSTFSNWSGSLTVTNNSCSLVLLQ